MTEALSELRKSGNRLLAQRDLVGAEHSFRELVARFPDEQDGYAGLATVFERSDRHEELVELLEQVVDRFSSQQLLRALGDACRVLANRGKSEFVDRAIEYYGRFHALRTDPVTLYYHADLLFKKREDYEGALVRYKTSWDADHRSQQAYMGVLNCLRKLGRTDEIDQMKTLWQERK